MSKPHPNLLLVEGKSEQFSLPFLMDNFVKWGNKKEGWVIEIKELDGIENLLKADVIETASRRSGLKSLGVIIDADDSFTSSWTSLKTRFRSVSENCPEALLASGLIHTTTSGLRIGAWIMPDNRSSGMLETFLGLLRKEESQPLWERAGRSCDEIAEIEGTFKAAHHDKAHVHTYLAWLDPPGKTIAESLRDNVLDSKHPLADRFATWLIDLYQLQIKNTPSP